MLKPGEPFRRLAIAGTLLWLGVIALDYFVRSEHLFLALGNFRYSAVPFLQIFILGGIAFLIFVKKPMSWTSLTIKSFRPIYLYPAVVLSMVIILYVLGSINRVSIDWSGFLSHLIKVHGILCLFVLCSYGIGRSILALLKWPSFDNPGFFISLAFGWLVLGSMLFVLGLIGVLTTLSAWLLLLSGLALGFGPIKQLVLKSWFATTKPVKLKTINFLLVLLGVFLVAINCLNTFSPVPLGFDSLNLYMNISKLISDQSSLVSGYQPYNWSLMSSLGYLLAGNNALALHISNIPGLISLFLIYKLSRLFLNINWSLFSAVAYLSLPVIMWQSAFEGKVDLAALFFGLTIILVILQYYRDDKSLSVNNELKTWAALGLLCGYMVGIKLTAVTAVFVLCIFYFYQRRGKWAAWASGFWLCALIFWAELYHFAAFEVTALEKYLLVSATAIFGLIFTFWSIKRQGVPKIKVFTPLLVLGLSFGILFMPWAIKNTLEHGTIGLSNLIEGKSALEPLSKKDLGIPQPSNMAFIERNSVPDVHLTQEETLEASAKYEEIRRYLGYEGGVMRFISLPYDISMKTNVKMWGGDPGIMLILILPLLVFSFHAGQKRHIIFKWLIIWLWLIISVWSATVGSQMLSYKEAVAIMEEGILTADGNILSGLTPFYLTVMKPLLFLGSLLSALNIWLTSGTDGISLLYTLLFIPVFYYVFKDVLSNRNKTEKAFAFLLFWYFVFWLLLSSGIIWYGLVGLSLAPMLLTMLFFSNKDSIYSASRWVKSAVGVVLALWFVLLVPFRLSPMELNTLEKSVINFDQVIPLQTLQYASGEFNTDEAARYIFNNETNIIINELNSNPNAKVLNIATFLKFFIKNNNKRLYKDDQLDLFAALWKSTNNSKVATASKLKKAGLDYLLIGLDAPTLDNTPDKTLIRKFEGLMQFLYDNPYVELISTDRYVVDPNGPMMVNINGQQVRVSANIFGRQVAQNGKLALIKLK